MAVKPIILFFFLFVYYRDSFSQDTAKYYYASGQLKLLKAKVNPNTIYEKSFYENGQLEGDGYVKLINGNYHLGKFMAYYKNGAIKVISSDTSYTMYEANGKVHSHNQTRDGINNGDSFSYLDGLLVLHNHYKNGLKDGKQMSYYMGSGKLFSEENYLDGKLEGLSNNYDTLGNIIQSILYKDDIAMRATYFDSKGKVVKTTNGKEEDKNRKNVKNYIRDESRH